MAGPRGATHRRFRLAALAGGVRRCPAQGWPAVLLAATAGGQEFAFCDARSDLGHLVELYEPSARLLGFYEMVARAAQGWDGSDPVRWP